MAGKVTFHLSVQNLAVDQAQILVVLRISSLVTLQSSITLSELMLTMQCICDVASPERLQFCLGFE